MTFSGPYRVSVRRIAKYEIYVRAHLFQTGPNGVKSCQPSEDFLVSALFDALCMVLSLLTVPGLLNCIYLRVSVYIFIVIRPYFPSRVSFIIITTI